MFLGNERHRIAMALAFGATASSLLTLINIEVPGTNAFSRRECSTSTEALLAFSCKLAFWWTFCQRISSQKSLKTFLPEQKGEVLAWAIWRLWALEGKRYLWHRKIPVGSGKFLEKEKERERERELEATFEKGTGEYRYFARECSQAVALSGHGRRPLHFLIHSSVFEWQAPKEKFSLFGSFLATFYNGALQGS